MGTLLGIDLGTSGVKVAVYDVDGNRMCSSQYDGYPTMRPTPDAAEHDPALWWDSVKKALRRASASVSLQQVEAVGLSGLNGLVPTDRNGHPLLNGIIYTDRRSNPQSEWIRERIGEDKIFDITGNRICPGTFSAPLILWTKENSRDIYKQTSKFLVPSNYLAYRLTGKFGIDFSRASMTLLFDLRNRRWDQDLLQGMEISAEKLPDIIPPWSIIGEVSSEAATETGLKKGTPVVIGGMDSMCSALGAGVTEPGLALDIGGSAGGIAVCSDKPIFDRRFLNVCHVVPDIWVHIGPMNAAGAVFEWSTNLLGEIESLVAKRIGGSAYDLLSLEIAETEAGAKGLIFLPYLAGERCPIWDPFAKGVFFGLTLAHQREDILRSVVEGVAFGLRDILETFKEANIDMDKLVLTGGGAENRTITQIKADILREALYLPEVTETATFGAAILAGCGVGTFKNIQDAVRSMVRIRRVIEPNAKYAHKYDCMYSQYKELYRSLKSQFRKQKGGF